MAIFKMMVGLPASGKSTYAKSLKEQGYQIFSSDDLRETSGEKDHAKVFEALHKEILKQVKIGKNCVLDALNLSQKNGLPFMIR